MEIPNLTPNEKQKIATHLVFALLFLGFFGLLISLTGFLHNKNELLFLGFFLSIGSIAVYLTMTWLEQKRYIKHLKEPIEKRIQELEVFVVEYQDFLTEIHKAFPIDSLNWSKAGSINCISLDRIIQGINERLIEANGLIKTLDEKKIFKAQELLETPLTFKTHLDRHLMEHEMPDMPANSWIESMKFLYSKIKEESEKFNIDASKNKKPKNTGDFINTLKTS
ncbi:MAG TPA: hypothetical protein PKA63_10460 [Oligoflexia bacterium]|nr:hypothetical protein [Oligoflexia bacterium]HMP49079.1 hypothetical protein [Oligoflexia bacterium]